MGHKFAELAFTPSVRAIQFAQGSRDNYAAMEQGADYNHRLGAREAAFIAARDSFYMASVSETGWPYVQHRGGPTGFMRVLDERRIGFADFSGNRQYVSTGNFMNDDRVALFFMDYPHRTRLKMLGRVRIIDSSDDKMLASLEVDDYRARVERGFVIDVEAFDWNCPQHITPRFTESEVKELMAPVLAENRQLKSTVSHQTPAVEVLGTGPLPLVVSGIRQLTPRVRAFELRDPEDRELPPVEAGSHLQVPVQLENGELLLRHYSICSNPARRDIYEIAVLREDAGSGGSRAVQESYRLGVILNCEMPRNHFALHQGEQPAVMIAGGIGITPIKAMAQRLEERGNALQIHFSARSQREMPFRDRLLRTFGERLAVYGSAEGKRMNLERIIADAPENAVFFVCGPGRLIDAVIAAAAAQGVDPQRVRLERFEAHIAADARALTLELRRTGKKIEVKADQSLLDAILDTGIKAPFSCRTGNCRTCAVKVLEGEAEHHDEALSASDREDQQLMCPCVSRAKGDHLVLDL